MNNEEEFGLNKDSEENGDVNKGQEDKSTLTKYSELD